ncbi:MAG: glycerophosphodiester phosphodiesterase family protein [Parvularculaceae bacterium]
MRPLIPSALFLVAACTGETAGDGGSSPAAAGGLPAASAPVWSIDAGGDLNAFFECLEAEKITLVDAHRGGPRPGFPENALATLAATLEIAPAILEIDIATSADGVLFLHHDDTLDEKTTGSGAPGALAFAEIAKLRLKDESGAITAFAPTRLDEALQWAEGRTILALDIKASTRYDAVADEVRRQGAEDRVLLIAYSTGQARKLHSLLPEAMISLNVASQSELNAAVAAGVPAEKIVAFTGVEEPDARLFGLLNERDVEVIFGTLGGRQSLDAEMARSGDDSLYTELAANGVDLIATDRPAAVQGALGRAGRAAKAGVCGIARN